MTRHINVLKALNVLVWLVAVYLLVNLFAYFLPLDVSNLERCVEQNLFEQFDQDGHLVSKQCYTEEPQTFVAGDELKLVNYFESFETAQSTYDNRLICRNGVETRVFIGTIVANTTPRGISRSESLFTIPDNIHGDNCFVQNTGTSCVQVLPLITRCITEITDSNKFIITED